MVQYKDGGYHYNHFQDGWLTQLKPDPKCETQQGWLNSNWLFDHCYLIDDVVVRKVRNDNKR